MKRALMTLNILIAFNLLAGCATNDTVPYQQLLAQEEGKMSVVLILPNTTSSFDVPSFMVGKEEYLTGVYITTIENFNNRYPRLEIDQTPYYIFFDSKGVIFQTNDENEAREVFIDNITQEKK